MTIAQTGACNEYATQHSRRWRLPKFRAARAVPAWGVRGSP